MFPGVAKLCNICFGRKLCVREAKMFLTPGKSIFCFRAAKFVSATHVSRAAKLGNICIRNNVSATMFPSLARPLEYCPSTKSRCGSFNSSLDAKHGLSLFDLYSAPRGVCRHILWLSPLLRKLTRGFIFLNLIKVDKNPETCKGMMLKIW